MREPCNEKPGLKKGPWTPEEDHKLITYIQTHGHSSWRALPQEAGLARCGKSCRLRWTNYLRPGIKRGNFTQQEENTIIQLHAVLGNRWSTISTHLPGRTDNEIKNHWNTRLRKRLLKMGVDPTTHRPTLPQPPLPHLLPPPSVSNTSLLLYLLQGVSPPSTPDLTSSLLSALLRGSTSPVNSNVGLFPGAPGHVLQNNAGAAPPGAPPHSSSPAALDPALLAAAETRLMLDYLKFSNVQRPQSSSSSDQLQIDQILNRLLLLRLLQGSNVTVPASFNEGAAARYDTPDMSRLGPFSSLLSADQLLQNLGLRAAPGTASMPSGAAAPSCAQQPSAYAHPNSHVTAVKGDGVSPSTMLLNMCSNSYQQRLLQTLPFLAESVVDTSASGGATDHLSSTSSHQISQGGGLLRRDATSGAAPTSGGFPSQQTWARMQAGSDHQPMQPQLAGGCTVPNHEHHQGLMTWEDHPTSEQKGAERELASASTVSSSTYSSGSQHPSGLAHSNFNIQDYWSDLLSLISGSSK